jgi:hypothetical protein
MRVFFLTAMAMTASVCDGEPPCTSTTTTVEQCYNYHCAGGECAYECGFSRPTGYKVDGCGNITACLCEGNPDEVPNELLDPEVIAPN